jgi:hypothetical protein
VFVDLDRQRLERRGELVYGAIQVFAIQRHAREHTP